MRNVYPEIEPFDTGMLEVSETHTLYYEQCGNPEGKPVVYLHGGPGGGTNPRCRRFFDPKSYRIILVDQRGSGKSTPHACLIDNTTWDLVADLEELRIKLGIEQWQLFGGSWGSALALAYAETFPHCVTELVLRGIFMLRHKELQWLYQHGASEIFPDAWEQYLEPIPPEERDDLITAYHKRLTGDDSSVQKEAARAWSVWEGMTLSLLPDQDKIKEMGGEMFSLAFARIESHYFYNKGFFRCENQLLEDIDNIRHIPAVIVQGRYDVVCPMRSAWDLHRAWPEAQFHVVPDAGHSQNEPGITHELIRATDQFRT